MQLARGRGIAGLIAASIIALILTGCNAQQAAAPNLAPGASTPTPPHTRAGLNAAQRTAADFLNAWVADNYDAMYALLTINSRDAFARASFEQLYRDTERKMTVLPVQGKAYTLTHAIHQSAGAEIAYDMQFNTQLFGSFTDPARLMRLVNTAEGWRVAWTPGDVLAELQAGGTLDVIQTRPNRGNIYDRNGEVLADMNGSTLVITLRTQTYPGGSADACFAQLARVFPKRSFEQMQKLFGPATGLDFAYEVGELNPERFALERAALEQVCTLEYANKPTRRYVSGGLAPHVVGYVGPIPAEQVDQWVARGYPPDALVGLDGVERYLEGALSGQGKARLVVRLRGREVRTLAEREAVPSQSVYLTLNRELQEGVQSILREAYTQSAWAAQSPGGAAIVMDVRTGEILAIASYPEFNVDAFNPNSLLPNAQQLAASYLTDPRKPTLNRATVGQYPPGSVFKIVSMAAAADSGVFSLNTRYTCTGTWNGGPIGDRLRKDWIAATAARQHGTITLRQALTGSCNIYFWHIGWTLNGKDPTILPDYARRMGFGASTGITDLADAPGGLPDPARYEQLTGRKWRGSDALNAVIGQGDVVVTPLQVVRAVAAIANGGTLYKPYVVEKIGIINEPTYVAEPVVNGRLNFKPEVIAGIRQAMCEVTTNPTLGTATFVFKDLTGVTVCGKTGTAETTTGGATHAWFAAFAGKTADEPEIAVVVMIERGGEGSFVAAPIARRIIERYFGITSPAQAAAP